MSLPGFSAEAALGRSRGVYASQARYGAGGDAVSLQGGFLVDPGGPLPIPDPPPIPSGVGPGGDIIFPRSSLFPGWVNSDLPLTWWEWLTEPIELGIGGTAAVATGAIAAGTLIGAGIGLGLQWLITPSTPATPAPTPGCVPNGPNTQHMVHGDYWGCDRSLAKTTIDAQNYCAALTGRCSGTCASGAPCKPYAVIEDVAQIPGWTTCETDIYFVCECGC